VTCADARTGRLTCVYAVGERWLALAAFGRLADYPRTGWRASGPLHNEHTFAYGKAVPELPTPELVENWRRSIAMLPSGAPALNRDEALELLDQLEAALVELRKLRAQGEVR
jgi:hypothetical protein